MTVIQVQEELDRITESSFIVEFKLVEQATKLLLRFIQLFEENTNRFHTIAELRRNFRTIGTSEAKVIINEFEKLGIVVGTIRRAERLFKFNDDRRIITQTFDKYINTSAVKVIESARAKRIAHAKKVLEQERVSVSSLEEFKKETGLGFIPEKVEGQAFDDLKSLPKTALELHEAKECTTGCRFCALEQDKALGF